MDYALNFPEQLSLHLKSLRKAAGISQAQLAQLLGVTQSRVAAIEKDPAAVSVGQFMAILQLLGAELVIRTLATSLPPPSAPRTTGTPPAELARLHGLEPKTPGAKTANVASLGIGPFKPQTLPPGWQNKKPKGSW